MLQRFLFIMVILLSSTSWAASSPTDPLNSPQWSTMHSRFLNNEPLVFDDTVKIQAPAQAEDSLNVPIAFQVTGLETVQEVVVTADLNPLPQVLRFRPKALKANLAFRMKLQQGSPIHIAAKDAQGTWHVSGVWVEAAGGGCTMPSVGTASGDWSKTLGQVAANVWQHPTGNRLRIRIMHPMDTGLASGIPTFHLENLNVLDTQGKVLAELDLFEPISENPMLSFDVAQQNQFRLEGRDNNGNRVQAEVQL